ncbi:glutamine amidotransferase [Oxalobacteraceae bacterium CAVE-383]|nr:glutamine amidotransferase [Oxalobacteraceae bacterium CAVE-383]
MKKLLALRHIEFEDLGTFEACFSDAGYAIQYIDTPSAKPAALSDIDPKRADLLVVLGGPMGVYETEAYPYLLDEIGIIKKRIAKRLPTLGICLGAQLIAAALGARVFPGTAKEIGWAPVIVTPEGQRSPLSVLGVGAVEGKAPAVLHWHGDTFDLPAGAIRLASTTDYANQAFSLEKHVLALQFHLEMQPAAVGAWTRGHAAELAAAGIEPGPLLRGDNAITPKQACEIMTAWLAALHLHG